MTDSVARAVLRVLPRVPLVALVAARIFACGNFSLVDDEPKPDPSGIATGDRASVFDAGGTAFVVAEPTDQKAPEYAQKKKDFDDYQAQAEKEPLAAKLADGKPRAFPAHNIPFVVTGTFILLFGWMGFNPGSTLGATDLRISVIAVNTNLAAVAGRHRR